MDIQLGALEEMLSAQMQFVLLGSGSPVTKEAYRELARRLSDEGRACASALTRDCRIGSRPACDFYLMPSRFEPCGLNQMYSLRYGAVPIVRVTGGLDDTVVDIAEDPEHVTGIKFAEYSPRALAKAMRKALVLYGEPKLLRHYRHNGMKADFSWDRMVKQYEDIYRLPLKR